jgi:hypothetical protein
LAQSGFFYNFAQYIYQKRFIMRKILLSSLLTLISIGAWAEFVEIDGINYYLEDTKAAVAKKNRQV